MPRKRLSGKKPKRTGVRVQVRVLVGDEIAVGPGKAELLEGIAETGSIAAAGRRMGMSYKRAWFLVDTLNRCLKQPAVVAVKGGPAGGGARLTETGEALLRYYKEIRDDAERRVAADLAKLLRRTPAPKSKR